MFGQSKLYPSFSGVAGLTRLCVCQSRVGRGGGPEVGHLHPWETRYDAIAGVFRPQADLPLSAALSSPLLFASENGRSSSDFHRSAMTHQPTGGLTAA